MEPATAADPVRVRLVPQLRQRGGVITNVVFAGDDLMLVSWKHGLIRWKSMQDGGTGELLALPTLREDGAGVFDGGESGLVGMALHPSFPQQPRMFLHYNRQQQDGTRHAVISEWTVSGGGTTRSAHNERVLLAIPQSSDVHNAGQLLFGPDGMLYIGIGDGEEGEWTVGRSPAHLLRGKVLRIDVDRQDPDLAYGIPSDNPFVGDDRFPPETWAWGLRNPWRLSFTDDGRMIAGDVGEDRCEEITIVQRGRHHGWPYFEGHYARNAWSLDDVVPVAPLYGYERDVGRSVIGGAVYRGAGIPGLDGHYVFGDLLSGRILAFPLPVAGSEGPVEPFEIGRWPMITTFATGPDGELYAGTHTGQVYRLENDAGDAPPPQMPDVLPLEDEAARAMFHTPYEGPLRPAFSDAQIELGRALYHDVRLSKNGDVSCASCHDLARYGQDGQVVSSESGGAPTRRNTPSTFLAHRQFGQFWDFRAESVEQVAFMSLVDEMGLVDPAGIQAALDAVPEYEPQFRTAFPGGGNPVGPAQASLALGAYLRQLDTRSRWDEYLDGDDRALTLEEKLGLAHFVSVGCMVCHQYRGLGGSMPQKLGLMQPWTGTDKGRGALEAVDDQDYYFKVPVLANVGETAPYYHDGSIATLEAAVRHMAEVQLGRQLDDDVVASISTFLRALTGTPPDIATK